VAEVGGDDRAFFQQQLLPGGGLWFVQSGFAGEVCDLHFQQALVLG
jgi:hypothetical protein